MSVPAEVRHRLAAARRAGETFTAAWPAAVSAALELVGPTERDHWLGALRYTKPAWRDGWDRAPLPPWQSILLIVEDDSGDNAVHDRLHGSIAA